MKIMMTAGFVLLGIGSIAGAFFFHDGVQKNKALIDHMEKIAALTLKISTMAGHLENFRQKASEDEHLIEKLQDELEVMADLNASLKDTKASDAAVRRAIAACREEKASLETLLTDERNKVRTIGLRLETVRQEIFDLSQKNEEKDRSIRSLEAALSKLEAEKAREKGAADRQIGALQSDSAQGLLRLQEAKETIRDHEIQIDAMKRSIQDMETRIGHTADENQRYRIRLKKMAVDNAAKDTQISYLLTEIQRTEDEAARRNAQLKKRIQEKERQIEKEAAQVRSLRGQIEADKKTQVFLENKFFKLHEQKDIYRIEADERMAELHQRITEIESAVEEKRRQLDEKDLQLDALRSAVAALETEREVVRNAREALKTELAGLRDAFEAELRLRETCTEALSELREQTLKTQEAVEMEVADFQDRLSEKERQLIEARAQIDALNNQVETENAALIFLRERISDLSDRLRQEQLEAAQRNDQLKRLVREKETQLQKATVQILNMRASIETAVGAQSDMAGRMSDLELQRHADINQMLTQLDEKIQRKNRQLEDALGEVEKWRTLYEGLEGSLHLRRDQVETLQRMVARTREEKGAMESRLKEMGMTYSSLIRELHDNLENKQATIQEYQKKLTVTFVDKILFGRAAVRISEEGKGLLKKTGTVLKDIQYGKIRIVGHTDSDSIRSVYRRIYPSNWELSSARAASVARFFQEEVGIAPEKMEILGLAYTQPVATNETAEGKAKNRRVEIVIIPDQ